MRIQAPIQRFVECGRIQAWDIPSFPYKLLWSEGQIVSVVAEALHNDSPPDSGGADCEGISAHAGGVVPASKRQIPLGNHPSAPFGLRGPS